MTAKAQRVLTERRELVGHFGVQSRYGCDKQLLHLRLVLAEADRVRHSSFLFDQKIDLPGSNALEASIAVSLVVAMGLWKAPDNIYNS
jgi:hypothetical protein